MKKLHLLCNAHLDVIWQWRLDEAAAAALSTFRVAADLCEEFDEFVFNHNEALLYQWTEEHDPALFRRIQDLVKRGKWHIIGGWTLQPDCLMLSGESFVRQIAEGRRYFKEKFGVEPETAVNFDSFGHTRGLVQILAQAGYKQYLFMRPDNSAYQLPSLPQLFRWKGYDEKSEVVGYRIGTGYNTGFGKAAQAIEAYTREEADQEVALRCWGIGDHGGGPSRQDLTDIRALIERFAGNITVAHSTPEAFFEERLPLEELPVWDGELISANIGCYTSLIRIKQKHRQLENALFSAEKISAAARLCTGMAYPGDELWEGFRALAILQFHDVLPGSCTRPAEEEALRLAGYGLELAQRIQTRALFRLTAGEKPAAPGEIPLFLWNPHPYEVDEIVESEFMLADQNYSGLVTYAQAICGGEEIPSQMIKEASNISLDWRKRIALRVRLRPMGVTRVDLRLHEEGKRDYRLPKGNRFHFDNGEMQVVINRETGLVDRFCVGGRELVQESACRLEVFRDNEDPWRMDTNRITEKIGTYTLLSPTEAARLAGVDNPAFEAVNRIEDGEVFTRIEAFFGYGASRARVVYTLPRRGTGFWVDITSYMEEKSVLVRLTVPTAMENPAFRGQSAFGDAPLFGDGRECTSQKWLAAVGEDRSLILANDGVYASSHEGNLLRQTLLRTPGYCAHPIENRPLMTNDRFHHRAEQGEREFHFRLEGVAGPDPVRRAEEIARVENEKPYALNIFPSGDGEVPAAAATLDSRIRLDAVKLAEDGQGLIFRLFNPENEAVEAVLRIPALHAEAPVRLAHHEVQSWRAGFDGDLRVCGLLE